MKCRCDPELVLELELVRELDQGFGDLECGGRPRTDVIWDNRYDIAVRVQGVVELDATISQHPQRFLLMADVRFQPCAMSCGPKGSSRISLADRHFSVSDYERHRPNTVTLLT